jgi:hypothetical protein
MAASCSLATPIGKAGERGRAAATWAALGAILLAGLALRGWILAGPLGEVEADESVVGLMALHIQQGEQVAFYWGQPYVGSLEAYLAAAAFALLGPSNAVLKAVPGFVFLVFMSLFCWSS